MRRILAYIKLIHDLTLSISASVLVCQEDEFRCANNEQCLPQDFVCNFVQDCSDNSDELNCGMHCKSVTVNFLNIRTPKKNVVITLKFELCGSTIE